MNWFTHYTRPPRKDLPPAGRNHLKRSPTRTLCGVALEPWLRNQTVIMDALTGTPAYPTCKKCERLAAEAAPALAAPAPRATPVWPILQPAA